MKVFFDSNIHVSNAVYGGAAKKAIYATFKARWRVQFSDFILSEVARVVPQLARASLATEIIDELRKYGDRFPTPKSRHLVVGDPNDTPILRSAIGAGADYLVTRDIELLKLEQVDSLRIITLADYLNVLRTHGHLTS